MKIRELIEQLQAMDPELPVYVASDAEGPAYGEVIQVNESIRDTRYGDMYEVDEDELPDDQHRQRVVVVWP